jgi:hypothetical protein
MYPKSKYGRALLLPGHETVEELQQATLTSERRITFLAWKEGIPATATDEI